MPESDKDDSVALRVRALPLRWVRSVDRAEEERRRLTVTLSCGHQKRMRWWPGESAPEQARCAKCRDAIRPRGDA